MSDERLYENFRFPFGKSSKTARTPTQPPRTAQTAGHSTSESGLRSPDFYRSPGPPPTQPPGTAPQPRPRFSPYVLRDLPGRTPGRSSAQTAHDSAETEGGGQTAETRDSSNQDRQEEAKTAPNESPPQNPTGTQTGQGTEQADSHRSQQQGNQDSPEATNSPTDSAKAAGKTNQDTKGSTKGSTSKADSDSSSEHAQSDKEGEKDKSRPDTPQSPENKSQHSDPSDHSTPSESDSADYTDYQDDPDYEPDFHSYFRRRRQPKVKRKKRKQKPPPKQPPPPKQTPPPTPKQRQSPPPTQRKAPKGPKMARPKAGTALFDLYEGADDLISQDTHEAHIAALKQCLVDKVLPVKQSRLFAAMIREAADANRPVGAHAVANLQIHYTKYLDTYHQILTLIANIEHYQRQQQAPKDEVDKTFKFAKSLDEEYQDVCLVYSIAMGLADTPVANMSQDEFNKIVNARIHGRPGTPPLPSQPTTLLLDRSMAGFIKPAKLTDQAKPAEIQRWSQSVISIFQMQRFDRLDVQLSLVFLQSQLDPSLNNVLTCFMENKPLYIDTHDTYSCYVGTPAADRKQDSMLRVVFNHFSMQWSRLKLMLNFWAVKQQAGETYPEYSARVKTEFSMVNAFQDKEEFLGFKLIEGVSDVNLRKELAKLDDFTLTSVDAKGLEYQKRLLNQKALSTGSSHTTHLTANAVQRQSRRGNQNNRSRQATFQNQSRPQSIKAYLDGLTQQGRCLGCGYRDSDNHQSKCPAKNQKCIHCGKVGHFNKMCGTIHTQRGRSSSKARSQSRNSSSRNRSKSRSGSKPRRRSKSRNRSQSRRRSQSDKRANQTEVGKVDPNPSASATALFTGFNPVCYMTKINTVEYPHVTMSPIVNVQFEPQYSSQDGRSFTISCIADSGTQVTLLRAETVKENGFTIYGTSTTVSTANGAPLDVLGFVPLRAKYNGQNQNVKALVVKDLHRNLLSFEDCIALGILQFSGLTIDGRPRSLLPEMATAIQQANQDINPPLTAPQHASVNDLLFDYKDVVGDDHVGLFKDLPPLEVEFKENYIPARVSRAAVVPIHLREAVRREMQFLWDQGIIRPIKTGEKIKQTSRCVVVEKEGGKVRLCVDLKAVNDNIAYNIPHPTGHISSILACLPPNMQYMAVFDMNRGYLQAQIAEETQAHLAFVLDPEVMDGQALWTYTRLPFGLNVSSSLFLMATHDAFKGLEGTFSIVDDFLVVAPDFSTFLDRLKALFERCKKVGVVLSRRKAQFGTSVIFSGHTISRKGAMPDPSKIEIIQRTTMPQSLTQMRSFLGMVNFLLQYHPGISQYTEVLNQLLKKNTAFAVLPHHEEAFQKLKELLLGPLCVSYYRPDWDQHLYTDASLSGLAFVFLQVDPSNGTPVLIQCGSRALRPAETRYAVTEVEALGLDFACSKLKTYMEGSKITHYFTDHASLVQMFKKPFIDFTNKKLMRIFLKIQHLRIVPQHISGSMNSFTDYYSRYHLPPLQGEQNVEAMFAGLDDVKTFHVQFDIETFHNLSCNIDFLRQQALLDDEYQAAVTHFKQNLHKTKQTELAVSSLLAQLLPKADDIAVDSNDLYLPWELLLPAKLAVAWYLQDPQQVRRFDQHRVPDWPVLWLCPAGHWNSTHCEQKLDQHDATAGISRFFECYRPDESVHHPL